MTIQYNTTTSQSLLSTRVYFEPYCSQNDGGILSHSRITAFVLRLFGLIVDVKDREGKNFYLNKISLIRWLKSHHADTSLPTYIDRINKVCADLQQRNTCPTNTSGVGAPQNTTATPQKASSEVQNPFINWMKTGTSDWLSATPSQNAIYEFKIDSLKKPSSSLLTGFSQTMIHDKLATQIVSSANVTKGQVTQARKAVQEWLQNHPEYVGQRVSIRANNNLVDVIVVGKKENLTNGRWTLFSNGTGEIGEWAFQNHIHRAKELNSNLVFFSYPGSSGSRGTMARNNLISSYLGVANFVKEVIEPMQMIYWGTSLGGGVQGYALKYYKPNPSSKHVFVKYQTFTKISPVVEYHAQKQGGVASWLASSVSIDNLVKNAKWQLHSVKTSRSLQHPEIIVQTANTLHPQKAEDILPDGCFEAQTSLATELLKDGPKPNKKFIGVQAMHCQALTREETNELNHAVLKALEPSFAGF